MHKMFKYIECISQICKKKICSENMQKYAVYMSKLQSNMQKSIIAYFTFICTHHFAGEPADMMSHIKST